MSATNPTSKFHAGWPTEQSIDTQAVFTALEDDDCRAILEETKETALTASEVSETCSIPLSTVYRKLETLSEAGLLDEQVRLCPNGKHSTEYLTGFEDVTISVGETGGVEVEISRIETQAPSIAAD